MDLNRQAERFLEVYQQGGELPGGWAYGKALRNLDLDYSIDSVGRIDALLYRLSSMLLPDQLQNEQDKNNTFLLLAFYLGVVIAKRCNLPIVWFRRDELPAAHDLNDGFESQAICKIGEMLFTPSKLIFDLLFVDDEQPCCLQLVDFYCKQIGQVVSLDEHQHFEHYLNCYFEGRDFSGGLLYRDLLQQTFPDGSVDSLSRLDELLQDIRQHRQPNYERWINQADAQNFLLFCAYYVSYVVARAGELSLRWVAYDHIKKLVPELPLEFETSRGCVIAQQPRLPVALICEILFSDQPRYSCQSYAEMLLLETRRQHAPELWLPPKEMQTARLVTDCNPLWCEMMKQAGVLAAQAMYILSDGHVVTPTLLTPSSKGRFVRPILAGSLDSSIQQGLDELQNNPNHLPYQVLIYQSYVDLPDARKEALLLYLTCHQGKRLQMSFALPFAHASQRGGFVIHSPLLLSSSASSEFYLELAQLFYVGTSEFQVEKSDFSWSRYVKS